MKTLEEQPACLVRPMRSEDIVGVAALAAEEATAPHWPVAEYHRMLDVIAASPARRGAWVLLIVSPAAGQQPVARQAGEPRLAASRAAVPPRPSRTRKAIPAVGAVLPVVGFAMASHVAGICDLEAVVVRAEWRGRRLGAALVEAAAAWGESLRASRLQLEVRDSNAAALRLYARMGFTLDGRRPGYYRNPDEEAVLMSLLLQPKGNGALV